MGYQFDVGPECEFFLFDQNNEGQPTTESNERAGYFDLGPVDLGENARRDMVLTLEDMGFEIEASHHEMSPAQHEIDFRYDEALKTADNIMTFKLAVKTIAKRHGMFASFMQNQNMGSMAPACMSICHWLRMVKIFLPTRRERWTQQRGVLVYRWNYQAYEGNDSDH